MRTEAAWPRVANTRAFRRAPTRAPHTGAPGLPAPPVTPRPPRLQGPQPNLASRSLRQGGPGASPRGAETERSRSGQGVEPGARKQDGGSRGRGVRLAGVPAVPATPAALCPGRVHFATRRREGASVPLRPGGWPGGPPRSRLRAGRKCVGSDVTGPRKEPGVRKQLRQTSPGTKSRGRVPRAVLGGCAHCPLGQLQV